MKFNNQKLIFVLIAIALIACNIVPAAVQSEDTIKIGAILMLSGTGSNSGINSQQGAELAVKEINSKGGINGKLLEIIYEDNQGDNPKAAVTALHKLIAQDVKVILGPNWSPSGNAVAPIACEEGILMISPSLGVAEFNEKCDYLFNVWPHDEILSTKLGEFLYKQGYQKIAILGSQQVWEETQAKAVKKSFENSGGEVVAFQLPQPDEKNFGVDVLKIKEANSEAVVIQYTYQDLVAKQLREIGVAAPIYVVLTDEDRIKDAAGALEGTIAITSFTPSPEFKVKFEKAYEAQPDIASDTSYDAIMLIAEAMKQTESTDPSILKDYLNKLSKYEGQSGSMIFDNKGGVTKSPRFMIVKDSKLMPYQP